MKNAQANKVTNVFKKRQDLYFKPLFLTKISTFIFENATKTTLRFPKN